jgi:hypothetical protein
MTKHLQDLLAAAKNIVLTPGEKEHQRHSFAYGNVAIENPRITREMLPPQNAKTGHSGDPGFFRAADEIGCPTNMTARPGGLA